MRARSPLTRPSVAGASTTAKPLDFVPRRTESGEGGSVAAAAGTACSPSASRAAAPA